MAGEQINPHRLPAKPDDVLPDSTDLNGACPRCGRQSNFTLRGRSPLTYDGKGYTVRQDGRREPTYDEQLSVLQCQGCQQNIVVVEQKYVGGVRGGRGGDVQWRGVHWWPAAGMRPVDPAVPEGVAEAVSEGVCCLAIRAPRAAAVMFRGALGQIVSDRGSPTAQARRTLAAQLQQMATDGDLDRTLAEWADHVRLLGNAGAHPNELDPVTLDEAEDLSRLINAMVEYLYVMPARVQRARGRRS